ncbi:LysM peptidoglycan-binding domain-containing protein (plasmid) [Ralstonia solanacearum]|nr:LysM peptidoglycan-binding domain-containing protein [Ralstonia solanacearum]
MEHAKRLFATCVACVFAATIAAASPAVAQSDTDEELLVIRITPREYHLDHVYPKKLSGLLANSFTKPFTVKPGQTLSGILQEQFNITQKWAPQTYESFATHVQQANGIIDPTRDIKAGQVLVLPDMPRGAGPPKFAAVQSDTRAQITFGQIGPDLNLAEPPRTLNQVSDITPREIQVRSMKRGQYAALKIDPFSTRRQMIEAGQPIPLKGAIVAKMAASDAAAVAVDSTSKAVITKLLRSPTKTRPYLIVLDDSWPSQDDFRRSVRFILEASERIRDAYSLQDPRGETDDVKLLKSELDKDRYGTTFCDNDCEYPQLKWHAAMVRRSLDDFRSLDTQDRVQVIYLPLNVAQRYAPNLLGEIMRVALLADSVSDQLVLKMPGGSFPAATQPGSPNFYDIDPIVKSILAAPALSAIPPAYTPGAELSVSTDKSIIDAVVNFMVLYSAASQRPHFISMSWTSPRNSLPATFRDDAPYGLWLAAAGNDPAVSVQAQLPLFAGRSTVPGDFIAVQNTASAGCDTSRLSALPALHVYGLAFPGRVDADHCGTSFSTPRVAWLLALREAAKGMTVKPSADDSWTQWKALRMEAVFRMTRPGQGGEDRYRVSIPQLLDEASP